MDRENEISADGQRGAKKCESYNDCNVLQKFPTLNIHTENSYVKIGDEFNFSKNVLIVVPDNLHTKVTSQSDVKKEENPRKDTSKEKLSNEKLNIVKIRLFAQWLLRYNPPAMHKAVIALTFAITAGVLLVILLNLKATDEKRFEIPEYVNRSVWESQQRKCAYSRLDKTAPLVIIQHTAGTFCCNFSECQQSVKNSQNYHLSLSYNCDVRFGFLVGGDCRIYEGRNFSQREKVPNDPFYNRSLEVAFIGNYSRDQPLDCQIKNFLAFLRNSVSAGFLGENFKVVGALQAYKYEHESPGKYLMDQIQQWDMWTNKTHSQL